MSYEMPGEFLRQLFSEEAELIRSERMIPEQEPVELDVLDTLADGILERIEEFVEVSRVGEF